MRVSVIVAFLNEEPYLEQCLQALLGQDFPREEYEVIFVDNGSRDGSAEIVRRYPDVHLMEEQRPGHYAARNTGLAVARGEVIAFTDGDCAPSSGWLRQICEGMSRTGAAMALGSRRLPHQGRGILQLCEAYDNAKAASVIHLGIRHHVFAYMCNMAMRADVVRALGPFAEWMRGADIEYVQRYLARFPGAQVVFLPDMAVTHLEITGLGEWLKKRLIYGDTTRRVEQKTSYRPTPYKERFRMYRACGDEQQYSVSRRLYLLGVIVLGVLWFHVGKLRADLEPWGAGE